MARPLLSCSPLTDLMTYRAQTVDHLAQLYSLKDTVGDVRIPLDVIKCVWLSRARMSYRSHALTIQLSIIATWIKARTLILTRASSLSA